MSEHDGGDDTGMVRGPDGRDRGRCPFVLSAGQLGLLNAEVIDGEMDGKPVLVVRFVSVSPDGGDVTLGMSEAAAMAFHFALRDFRTYARQLKEVPPDPVDPPETEKGA